MGFLNIGCPHSFAASLGDPVAKRVPAGNLLNRLVGVVLGLTLLNWLGPQMFTVDVNPRLKAAR